MRPLRSKNGTILKAPEPAYCYSAATVTRRILMSIAVKDDKQVILDHIRAIFQAYLNRDRATIRSLHTEDWIGFQGPSTRIERGIDAYMENADKSLSAFRGVSFDLLDTEVRIYGDVAIVYYIARYDYQNPDGSSGSVPLRSVDIYQRLNGEWNQVGSHISPIPAGGKWGEGDLYK
jgi:ketosteroid isomerase-like protein